MQLNSILFPGAAIDVATPMQNIIYIPRGKLREPNVAEEEEKKGIQLEESKGPGPYKDKKVQNN